MMKLNQFFLQVSEGLKNICKLSTRYKEINIKQQAQVPYFWCVLDKSMSGDPMALKVTNKINEKLNSSIGKINF